MKRSLLIFAATATLLCLGGRQASASPNPPPQVAWSYNFTPSQTFVSADSPGTGTVTFTNEPTKTATNSSDVVVTNLRVSSTAPATSPDALNTNGGWKIGLSLTDTASGTSSPTLFFTGKLGGTFSSANSNVNNAFNGTQTYTWTASNGNQYVVTLTGYTPPGPPTASNAGSISAHVTVTPGVGISGNTPEPSTLVLSCLGLAFGGFTTWRKRRRSMATLLA